MFDAAQRRSVGIQRRLKQLRGPISAQNRHGNRVLTRTVPWIQNLGQLRPLPENQARAEVGKGAPRGDYP